MSHERPLGLSSHIFVTDTDAAIGFYRDVFGATELFRQTLPDGTVLFVELAFGPAKLLVSEEVAALGAHAPPTVGGSPVLLLLETTDVDGAADRAVKGRRGGRDAGRGEVLGGAVRRCPRPVRPPVGAVHAARAAGPR